MLNDELEFAGTKLIRKWNKNLAPERLNLVIDLKTC
jgi:hypothetical protein